ncbi:hypothetical protein RDWZM_001250 [Blomia tropicalis]|uniref:Uncharacterized protein n=1 Tax=Blomia tropicalis TaxID=40697 RepID=A0A9Q0MB92_BLOTA|nr:hypothetical protein RDWZM_001250 [Blomia tropicalis]
MNIQPFHHVDMFNGNVNLEEETSQIWFIDNTTSLAVRNIHQFITDVDKSKSVKESIGNTLLQHELIKKLTNAIQQAIKNKKESEKKRFPVNVSQRMSLMDISTNLRMIPIPLDEVKILIPSSKMTKGGKNTNTSGSETAENKAARQKYAQLFFERTRYYQEAVQNRRQQGTLSSYPNFTSADFRHDAWQVVQLYGGEKFRFRTSIALQRSYRTAVQKMINDAYSANGTNALRKRHQFESLAKRMLQRCEDLILREAYWDYSYAEKAALLQRQYKVYVYDIRRSNRHLWIEPWQLIWPKPTGTSGSNAAADSRPNSPSPSSAATATAASQHATKPQPKLTSGLVTFERVRIDEKTGRLIAARKLKAKEFVFVEKICSIQHSTLHYCSHCFKPIPRPGTKWVPCRDCISSIFCSVTCRELAKRDTTSPHHYLCGIVNLVQPIEDHACFSMVSQLLISFPALEQLVTQFSECVAHQEPFPFRKFYQTLLNGSRPVDERTLSIASAFVVIPLFGSNQFMSSLEEPHQSTNRYILANSTAIAQFVAIYRQTNLSASFIEMVYSICWFLYHHPLTNLKLANGARWRQISSRITDTRPIVFGPFGSRIGLAPYPNIAASIDRNNATIKYYTTTYIQPGEVLSFQLENIHGVMLKAHPNQLFADNCFSQYFDQQR